MAATTDTKKKTKSQKVLDAKYQPITQHLPIHLKTSLTKGRHLVSASDLPAGTLVGIEQATSCIVRNHSFIQTCHYCMGQIVLTKQKTPPASCQKCKMAAYCSDKCKQAHGEDHLVQCAALAEANRVAGQYQDVGLEQLRGVLALVAAKANQKGDLVLDGEGSTATPFACVGDLNPNRHNMNRQATKNLQLALKELLALIPAQYKDQLPTVSEAVDLACIFATNHHTLGDSAQQIQGLFPFHSLFFQHSCQPNCVFVQHDRNSRVICVRTLCDVKKDQELTLSYVDLYQPREQRRRELLLGRQFWCKCRRCSQLLSHSVDRLMDGIRCRECQDGVMIFEETKEVQDINELLTDMSALDQEIQGKFAHCEKCSSQIEVTQLVEVLKSAITDYSAAQLALQQGQLSRARQLLETFVRDYEASGILDPHNAYLVNTYLTLVRVCHQLGDLDRAIKYSTVVLQQIEDAKGAMSENNPRLVEYYWGLGEMALKLAKIKSVNKTAAGRSMTRRHFKEAKPALERALKGREVVFGKDSRKVEEVKRCLEDYKKEYDEYLKANGLDSKKKAKKQSQ